MSRRSAGTSQQRFTRRSRAGGCKALSSVSRFKFEDADCLWPCSASALLTYLHAPEQFFGCVAPLHLYLSHAYRHQNTII